MRQPLFYAVGAATWTPRWKSHIFRSGRPTWSPYRYQLFSLFDLFDFFLRSSRQISPFKLLVMRHVEDKTVCLVEDDLTRFQFQVKDVTAFFPVR